MLFSSKNGGTWDAVVNGSILTHAVPAKHSRIEVKKKVKPKTSVLDDDTEPSLPVFSGGHQLCTRLCEGGNYFYRW